RRAGVQVLMMATDSNSISRMSASCARQGFTPTYGMPGPLAVASLQSVPTLEGTAIGTNVYPWPSEASPAAKEFHDAFRRYGPKSPVDAGNMVGWVAAKLFERATRNLPEPPTTAAILDGLWSIRNDDLAGLTYPLTFVRDQ